MYGFYTTRIICIQMPRQSYYRAESGGGRAVQAWWWAKARDLLTSPSFVAMVLSVMMTFSSPERHRCHLDYHGYFRERDVGGGGWVFHWLPSPSQNAISTFGIIKFNGAGDAGLCNCIAETYRRWGKSWKACVLWGWSYSSYWWGGVNWLIKPWLVSRKWVCLISGEDWGAAGAGGGEARDEGRLSCAKRASRRGWEAWKELVPCFFRHFCLILSLRQENLYFTTSARLIFPELSSSKGLAQKHHLGMAVVQNFFFFFLNSVSSYGSFGDNENGPCPHLCQVDKLNNK